MAYADGSIMSEHEAAPKDSPEGVYQPTDDERRTAALVKKLFSKSKKWRSKYDQEWMHFYRMFRGKQWKDQRPSYRHSEVINLIFTNLQTQTALMTDSRPKIGFTPTEPQDFEFAQLINDLSSYDWERNNWLMSLCEVILDAHLYGVGNSQTCYRGDLDNNVGSATYESVDPLECYPDPDAVDVNDRGMDDKSTYFIRAQPFNVDKLKAKYPDKAPYLKADLHEFYNDARTDIRRHLYRSPVDNRIIESSGSGQYGFKDNDMCLLITCWVKDDSIVEEMVKCLDDEGNETEAYEQRKKYPNGRKIIMQGDVVLEDGPNPYDDGEFPYERLVNYILSREYYGISEIENLESPQRMFNKLVSFALDVLTLMGNPIWIIPTSSGIDTDLVTNRPGEILEPDGVNHGIQRQEGVQLQPYVMQLINSMQQWFDTVGGSNDITRGVSPSGVSAASAISQLQDAAQTRIRQKTRNLDNYLKCVGRHYLSRVMQFYSVQRVVRVTNNADGSQKYFRFSIAKTETGQSVARVVPYIKAGNHYIEEPMREIPVKAQFDVEVQTASSLPFAKAEKEQRLYALFDRGIIDAEEVLSGLDFPNAKLVLERVQAKAQEMAQAQQQQARA